MILHRILRYSEKLRNIGASSAPVVREYTILRRKNIKNQHCPAFPDLDISTISSANTATTKCRKTCETPESRAIHRVEKNLQMGGAYSPVLSHALLSQFFESINPKNDFKSNEDLEEYLYNKSLEIQPKGVETPSAEVKPKHTSSTLRSPGIKPPKAANHYSANHPIGLHLHTTQLAHPAAAAHQSSTVPNTPVTAHETKRSYSHNQDDGQFAMVDVRYDRKGTHQKIPVLQPPPLIPRVRNQTQLPPTTQAPMPPLAKTPSGSVMSTAATSPTSTLTTPSSGPAPKLHPRRVPPPMSPLAKSPLTPANGQRLGRPEIRNVVNMAWIIRANIRRHLPSSHMIDEKFSQLNHIDWISTIAYSQGLSE
uniref:Uncharacterized protein n=1 Tax=Caenorhabditis japonica TaxID=281687 RepID=A0A8R1E6Y5_CAEJA